MMQKKYFGTDGIRGKVGEVPISADWFLKLGWAVGRVLSGTGHGRVLIGKDTRISGYMFESALEAGLVAAGANVHLLGPMPTAGIAYLTRTLQADAGIVISASHNSYEDNGIKFFSPEGVKLSDELELEIEAQLELPMNTVAPQELGKAVRVDDAQGRYIEFCKSTFPGNLNLKGLKIVVDCANGAAYHVAPSVFQELGAETIAIGNTPDGLNINKNCGAVATQKLAEKVIEVKADVGIALDGDADRTIFVDHAGTIVDGDELLGIIAFWYHRSGREFGGVAGTMMTNLGLEQSFKRLGIPFCRTKVGDRHVIATLKQRGWLLGGESSGHIICLDAHSTGDGIISALRVLAAMVSSGQSLFEEKQQMYKYPQVLLNIPTKQELDLQSPTIKSVVDSANAILNGEGRVLLRASGTEPFIRVMVEGKDEQKIGQIAQNLRKKIVGVMQAV